MEQILTLEQFAEKMQIGHRKAYEMLRSGEVKARKVGTLWRILESEVDRYMRQEPEVLKPKRRRKA